MPRKKDIEYKNMEELLQHPKILGLFRARIDTLQQQFAHYEQVKRFTLYDLLNERDIIF